MASVDLKNCTKSTLTETQSCQDGVNSTDPQSRSHDNSTGKARLRAKQKLVFPEPNLNLIKMTTQSQDEQKHVYSKEMLLRDWRAMHTDQVPNNWKVQDTGSGILFSFGHHRKGVTRSILVRNDMTAEIRVERSPVTYRISIKITSLQDILRAMALAPVL
ncbi:hypothetical protein NQ315_013681 [Exocentrus adspersus]|uniref:Uncharacterized protein n=1 Tax=Exocentrus adspersus TaxID=1586481 RepID=A0AAV8W4E5_9CUCU|nr:hypothetical protein NQ315_013681 [Exocentrus adspersus]